MAREEIIAKYPRIVAHIICHSLGYATPTTAALILKDAKEGKENWCEWIYSCYNCQPKGAVRDAVAYRHSHKGFMASYAKARLLVEEAINQHKEPVLMSW